MTKLKPVVVAVSGALFLSACSAPEPRQPLRMEGVQRVSQSAGQSAASWYQLGKYHQQRGQINLALGAYAQSLALDAGQLDARNAVAAIEAQQGQLTVARDALLRLAADYPAEAQPLNNLGYVYYLMADYANAIATLRRAVALEPNGRAQVNLAQAEAAAARTDKAAMMADGAPAPAAPAVPVAPTAPTMPATASAVAVAPAIAAAAVAEFSPSRMELVEVAPHVLELKLRASQSIAAVPALPAAAPVAVPSVHIAAPVVAAPVEAALPAQSVAGAAAIAPPAVAVAAAPAQTVAPHPVLVATMAAAPQVSKPVAIAAAPAPAVDAKSAAVAPVPTTALATTTLRLEISNGNGVTGLAARYRSVLGKVGILASRLSNARPFRQQASVIEYRPGFAAQAASLQRALRGRTSLQQSDALARADVRLLLGKDAPAQLAQAEQLLDGARFAAVDPTR